MTEPGHLDPDLGPLVCRLDLDENRVNYRKSSETLFGRAQSRACPFDIDLVGEFGTVGQNGHYIVSHLGEPAAHG